jgi:hypothetical protein
MSTAALKQDAGGLHFDYTGGYEEFGNRIYELIARDLYGIANHREIDAPMITAAYLADSTTLVVQEKADSLLKHDTTFSLQTPPPYPSYEIENALSGTIIDSIFPKGNKFVLKLSQYPGPGVTVSYLAPVYDSGTNWLTNTNGLDMVCFYKYPVADSIKPDSGAGVPMIYSLSSVKAYPNPFHSYTSITLPESGKYTMELNDLAGRKIQTDVFTGALYQLSAEGLAKGVYFVRVFNTNNALIGTTKLVVQ